jgi:hypothetical protein
MATASSTSLLSTDAIPHRRIVLTSGRRRETPEYAAWRSMRKRCRQPNTPNYDDYGGRGITVCNRWYDSFVAFFNDVGLRPSPRHALGRVENNGNYEPGNVEWQTEEQQANNRRVRRFAIKPRRRRRRLKKVSLPRRRRYGRWKIVAYAGSNKGAGSLWLCRCRCGAERVVKGASLVSGRSQSCGCRHKEVVRQIGLNSKRHGLSNSPEYRAWNQAIQRCTNPKLRNYKDYGGRGIRVCSEWLHSFEAFYAHIGPRPSSEHSLDRYPDNNGDYEPGNVRWATREEQRTNNRHTHKYIYRGELLTVAEIARRCGIGYRVLRYRLVVRNWPILRATTQSADEYHKGSRHVA